MDKIFGFVIRHKALILILTVVALAITGWQITKININSDVASYLPEDCISKQTFDILKKDFSINGDALVCFEGDESDFAALDKLAGELTANDEIDQIQWLGSYKDLFKFENGQLVSAQDMIGDENVRELTNGLYLQQDGKNYYIFNISMKADNATNEAAETLKLIENTVSGYAKPYYIGGNAVQSNDMMESAFGELPMFMGVALAVISVILLLTSKSLMSALIFLITIGISIVFNMGTNFFTPNISTVTFSVASILQLALSMDYSIFLTHAYNTARLTQDVNEAMLTAIKKTLVVIAASALTTVAGFCALFAMKYEMGFDLGLCLAKGVTFSFLTVIFVQPCLMIVFRKACDKTTHKTINPSFKHMARLPGKLRIAAPIIGVVLLVPAIFFSTKLSYYYMDSNFDENATGPQAVVQEQGTQNIFVCQKVSGEKQLELARKIKEIPGVTELTGYYNILDVLTSGIELPVYSSETEKDDSTFLFNIHPSDSDIISMMEGKMPTMSSVMDTATDAVSKAVEKAAPARVAAAVYQLEAQIGRSLTSGEYASLAAGITQQVQAEIQSAVTNQLFGLQDSFKAYSSQLEEMGSRFFATRNSTEYTFFTAKVAGQPEGDAAKETVAKINETVAGVLNTDKVYSAGNTQTIVDLAETTGTDFIIVSVLSAIMILVILIVTFKSLLMPIMLVMLIELAILINLSISALVGHPINFMSYVIISAIQLGATIDYAILMTKNYHLALVGGNRLQAAVETVRESSFPILVSMSILCGACMSVYLFSSDTIIREITMLIARGSFISGLLVLVLLPALLTHTEKSLRKTKYNSLKNRSNSMCH